MYFFNGDHIYRKPRKRYPSVSEELSDCVEQLEHINEGKKIFRLNFFARVNNGVDYQQLKGYISRVVSGTFSWPVVFSLIAQAPFTGNIIVEAFYYDTALWQFSVIEDEGGEAVIFRRGDVEVLAGSVQNNSGKGAARTLKKLFYRLEDCSIRPDFVSIRLSDNGITLKIFLA